VIFRALPAKPADDERLWIAHFGGSYNPVHTGHLAIARRLVDEFAFDRVVFVPTSSHYPKPGLAPEVDRLCLLERAVVGEPRFEASAIELGKETWTEPLDTIVHLKNRFEASSAGVRMFTVRGDDWLPLMLTWDELVDHEGLYEFIIVPRERPDLEAVAADPDQVALIQRLSLIMGGVEPFEVSSELVRQQIERGTTESPLVPPAVLQEIKRRGMYGAMPRRA
jgi:nicotinate-nucleotide adenylyltransferase